MHGILLSRLGWGPELLFGIVKYGIKRDIQDCRSFTYYQPLPRRRNVASLSFFYRYYFSRYSSELAKLVPLTLSRGRSTCYSDRLHDFSVIIPRCYKDVYVNSFFLPLLDSVILCLLNAFL